MNSKSTTQPIVRSPNEIIHCEDAASFRENYNRASFMFSHNLAGHPLFEIPRLITLANTLAETGVKYRVTSLDSNVPTHVKWSDMKLNEQVAEAIEHISEAGSLVIIKSVNLDPEYNTLMQQILTEIEQLTGIPLRQEITWAEAYIFISSPHSVTPYHIDHEANFLFQIHGEKEMHLFDPFDREILPEQEIEKYFGGDLQAANYKQEYQSRANVYQLTSGKAVHHPSLAPHWVKNGDDYSVSLSINFCVRPVDLKARIYQVNHFLRKLGLKPTPAGQSSIKDRAKMSLMGMFTKHQPSTKDDVVFSGINRIKFPIQALRRLKQLLKSRGN